MAASRWPDCFQSRWKSDSSVLFQELGRFDGRNSGTSLAIWENPAEDWPVRPRLREEGRDHDSVSSCRYRLGSRRAVDRGYLYAYADERHQCYCLIQGCQSSVSSSSLIERHGGLLWVSLEQGLEGCKSDLQQGAAPMLSVHWNNYLKKYLAVHSAVWEHAIIRINTADRPEGPWLDSGQIFKELPPEDSDGRNWGRDGSPGPGKEEWPGGKHGTSPTSVV